MGKLTLKPKQVPTKEFEWRDSHGICYLPRHMETRHLFHTISMIWNHTMPKDAKTHNYNRYYFNPKIYSREYMMAAVQTMLPILLHRKDLKPHQKARLDFMYWYLNGCTGPKPLPPKRIQLPPPNLVIDFSQV